MRHVLTELSKAVPLKPTEKDIQEAQKEFSDYVDEYGETGFMHPRSHAKVYLAKDKHVRDVQWQCLAYTTMMRRLANEQGLSDDPKRLITKFTDTEPEKTEEQLLAETIAFEQDNATLMMGNKSIFAGITLSSPELKETECVKWYRNNFTALNAILVGRTGIGKTFATVAYMAATMARPEPKRVDGMFIKAYDLSQLVQERDYVQMRKVKQVGNLLIDDLGALQGGYKGSDFKEYFENLFAVRHQNARRTFITSNLTERELLDLLGDRFISRFRESGQLIAFAGKDLRERKVA